MMKGKFLILCACAVVATAQLWAEPEAREVVYHTEAARGYLAIPDDAENAPALILIHEWWGLNDDIRAKAREFAKDGYVALAVDLYDGEVTDQASQAIGLARKVSGNQSGAFDNLRAAAEFLRALPQVDGARIGSVGWCFGGGWSYQIAKNNLGAKASVIYYGAFNPEDDLSQMRAKILGHFGEKDQLIKIDGVRVFQARLKTLSGEHEVFIYPNAGHGFANPTGSAYHQQSADTAYQRTLEFFERNL